MINQSLEKYDKCHLLVAQSHILGPRGTFKGYNKRTALWSNALNWGEQKSIYSGLLGFPIHQRGKVQQYKTLL